MIQNKHIIRLSFIGLFLNIIANIVLYRYFMIEEVVIKQISNQNARIAEIYKHKIWTHNKSAIVKLKNQDFESLMTDPDFIQFAQKSSQFFEELKSNISLYDKNGRKFIESQSNDFLNVKLNDSAYLYNKFILLMDKYFLSSYFAKNPLMEAMRGKTRNMLISRAIVTDQDGLEYETSFIVTYIPIIDSENGEFSVDGIVEITTNVTDQWNNIAYLEKRIFISFIIIFLVFFIIQEFRT